MTLDEIPVGQMARIVGVDPTTSPVMLRLMEMGLVRGASVEVRKRAPFLGPLELRVEGYLLSIRREQARLLHIELGPAPASVAELDRSPHLPAQIDPSPSEEPA